MRIHALVLPRTGLCLTDSLALAAAVLGPLAVYVLTLSHTVAFEDDGLFLMAGAHLGIAHPPGYPIYTLILHLFMQLPFGTPAFLGHLSSAFLGALACGGVYLCARLLGAAALPALAAAWLFGASEHVWSQSIIAEVYALNSLLFLRSLRTSALWLKISAASLGLDCGGGVLRHEPCEPLAACDAGDTRFVSSDSPRRKGNVSQVADALRCRCLGSGGSLCLDVPAGPAGSQDQLLRFHERPWRPLVSHQSQGVLSLP